MSNFTINANFNSIPFLVEMFIWNMAISFQLFFVIISGVIFVFVKDKSFKYYALYNLFLLLYLLSRNDEFYDQFQNAVGYFLGSHNAEVFTQIFNFYIQIIFYTFYSLFALYFLDLNKRNKKYFNNVLWLLKFLVVLFLFFGVLTFSLKNAELFVALYTFLYLPVMLIVFFLTIVKAVKNSGNHKYFFLFGVIVFVICALISFIGTFVPSLNIGNPMVFFYVGIVIETIFFSLGLAYKIKLMNDEKNRIHFMVIRHKHQKQISKLQGLLEGEENERKRIAEELHDGIAGDLSAIKLNLSYLKESINDENNDNVLEDLSKIIEKSCLQIREISHNLSPSPITNYGIVSATRKFCKKIEDLYKIKVNFSYTGEKMELSKIIETHIYRIIQELLNNIVKHSEAQLAEVKITYDDPFIEILVKDNGKGFVLNSRSKGIGLSNIESRVRYMKACVKKESTENGSTFTIMINLNEIPKT